MDEQNFKSFLNYTGNKFQLLEEINNFYRGVDKEHNYFIDVFCGSGTVGYNSGFKNVIFIDSNKHIIELHKYMYENSFEDILRNIQTKIKKYKLTNSFEHTYKKYKVLIKGNVNNGLKELNEEGYYKLREDYNKYKKNLLRVQLNCFLFYKYILLITI